MATSCVHAKGTDIAVVALRVVVPVGFVVCCVLARANDLAYRLLARANDRPPKHEPAGSVPVTRPANRMRGAPNRIATPQRVGGSLLASTPGSFLASVEADRPAARTRGGRRCCVPASAPGRGVAGGCVPARLHSSAEVFDRRLEDTEQQARVCRRSAAVGDLLGGYDHTGDADRWPALRKLVDGAELQAVRRATKRPHGEGVRGARHGRCDRALAHGPGRRSVAAGDRPGHRGVLARAAAAGRSLRPACRTRWQPRICSTGWRPAPGYATGRQRAHRRHRARRAAAVRRARGHPVMGE